MSDVSTPDDEKSERKEKRKAKREKEKAKAKRKDERERSKIKEQKEILKLVETRKMERRMEEETLCKLEEEREAAATGAKPKLHPKVEKPEFSFKSIDIPMPQAQPRSSKSFLGLIEPEIEPVAAAVSELQILEVKEMEPRQNFYFCSDIGKHFKIVNNCYNIPLKTMEGRGSYFLRIPIKSVLKSGRMLLANAKLVFTEMELERVREVEPEGTAMAEDEVRGVETEASGAQAAVAVAEAMEPGETAEAEQAEPEVEVAAEAEEMEPEVEVALEAEHLEPEVEVAFEEEVDVSEAEQVEPQVEVSGEEGELAEESSSASPEEGVIEQPAGVRRRSLLIEALMRNQDDLVGPNRKFISSRLKRVNIQFINNKVLYRRFLEVSTRHIRIRHYVNQLLIENFEFILNMVDWSKLKVETLGRLLHANVWKVILMDLAFLRDDLPELLDLRTRRNFANDIDRAVHDITMYVDNIVGHYSKFENQLIRLYLNLKLCVFLHAGPGTEVTEVRDVYFDIRSLLMDEAEAYVEPNILEKVFRLYDELCKIQAERVHEIFKLFNTFSTVMLLRDFIPEHRWVFQ